MYDPTTEELMRDIEEAEKLRDKHLHGVDRIVKEYTGRWYRAESGLGSHPVGDFSSEDNPEPFAYSFVSNLLPSLINSNPAVNVRARNIVEHETIAQAIESGLNGLLLDVPFQEEMERAAEDMLFFQGILMHYIEDDTRWSDGAVRPTLKRIDFRRFAVDSLANTIKDAAFMCHWYELDKADLMADPEVNQEALEQLEVGNTTVNSGATHGDRDSTFKKGDTSYLKHRRRVRIYSVWLRETNTLRVVARGGGKSGIELYEPRPYYGPDDGPYTILAAYPVPNEVYPLSPLIAVHDQVRDLQTFARAASRSAAGRKSVILVDSSFDNLDERIHEAIDREVIGVSGLNASQVQQLELGGVTPQQYEYLSVLRGRLDRTSGLNDLVRGVVGNADTATEASIAQEALNNRTEYLKSKAHKGASEALGALGWFLFHTHGIIIPVTKRDPMTGMESSGLFFGGQFPGENAGSWKDYQIKVSPYSMQRVSEQLLQRRAMEMVQLVERIAPQMAAMPWVRWMDLIKMVGDSLNLENVERLFIPEMLGMMGSPALLPPSQAMGFEQPGQRYSVPGQGFDPGGTADTVQARTPGEYRINSRRSELSRPFGEMYGGTQGPPGSRVM